MAEVNGGSCWLKTPRHKSIVRTAIAELSPIAQTLQPPINSRRAEPDGGAFAIMMEE